MTLPTLIAAAESKIPAAPIHQRQYLAGVTYGLRRAKFLMQEDVGELVKAYEDVLKRKEGRDA